MFDQDSLGNQYQSRLEFHIDSIANILAASVSELSLCSTNAVKAIELSLEKALAEATSEQVKAVYDSVYAAFTERDNNEEETIL